MILRAYDASTEPGSSLVLRRSPQDAVRGNRLIHLTLVLQHMRTSKQISVAEVIPLILSLGGGSHYHLVAWSGISEGNDS